MFEILLRLFGCENFSGPRNGPQVLKRLGKIADFFGLVRVLGSRGRTLSPTVSGSSSPRRTEAATWLRSSQFPERSAFRRQMHVKSDMLWNLSWFQGMQLNSVPITDSVISKNLACVADGNLPLNNGRLRLRRRRPEKPRYVELKSFPPWIWCVLCHLLSAISIRSKYSIVKLLHNGLLALGEERSSWPLREGRCVIWNLFIFGVQHFL